MAERLSSSSQYLFDGLLCSPDFCFFSFLPFRPSSPNSPLKQDSGSVLIPQDEVRGLVMGGGRKTPSHNSYRLLLFKILSSLSPYLPVEKLKKGDSQCEPDIGEQQVSMQVSFTPR